MSASGRPGRAWGWHPLRDEWAARLVADAAVRPGDVVFDIGAGNGALTRPLVAAGAHVIAVELHPGRAQSLRRSFAHDPVVVVECDAADLRLPRGPFRVVASPPYNLSRALLRLLLQPRSSLVAADLVLQRAVVRQYAGDGGTRFRYWSLVAGRPLPRTAFCRPPRVDSRVLVIRRTSRCWRSSSRS